MAGLNIIVANNTMAGLNIVANNTLKRGCRQTQFWKLKMRLGWSKTMLEKVTQEKNPDLECCIHVDFSQEKNPDHS